MTPGQLAAAAQEVQERWPTATLNGFHGDIGYALDVSVDGLVVAQVSCDDGGIYTGRISAVRSNLRLEH